MFNKLLLLSTLVTLLDKMCLTTNFFLLNGITVVYNLILNKYFIKLVDNCSIIQKRI